MTKTLYILRHAKTEALASGQKDQDRHLMPRGMEDATRMGEYLAAQGIRPDKVLCSTATRVQETVSLLLPLPLREGAGGGGILEKDSSLRHPLPLTPSLKGRGNIEYTDKMYLASAGEMLGFIAATPETVHSLMLIGHNPGLHELCLRLAKNGDNDLRSALKPQFPTCALATIAFDGRWQEINHAQTTLTGFLTPKML